jgi:hypothetical protein
VNLVEEKYRKQKQRKGQMAIEIAAEFQVWMYVCLGEANR